MKSPVHKEIGWVALVVKSKPEVKGSNPDQALVNI